MSSPIVKFQAAFCSFISQVLMIVLLVKTKGVVGCCKHSSIQTLSLSLFKQAT